VPDGGSFARLITEAEALQRFPGLLGIGYSASLAPGEAAAFEERQSKSGRPQLHVWPRLPGREPRSAVELIEPSGGRNARLLGFDMMTEERRAAAMERASDTGQPSLSQPVRLVVDDAPDAPP